MTWYFKNKTALTPQSKYMLEQRRFTTNNKGQFIDAKLTSSRYNIQCIGMNGAPGPTSEEEYVAQDASQSVNITEGEDAGIEIISFSVKGYSVDKKLVYSAYLGDSEICHGSVLNNGSFYCAVSEADRPELRVKLHSPYGLGEDEWYDSPEGDNSVNDFDQTNVNQLTYPYVTAMKLTFFISTSVSETTTCGGFSVLGEMFKIQTDGSEASNLNATCELESQEDFPASMVYNRQKITSVEIPNSVGGSPTPRKANATQCRFQCGFKSNQVPDSSQNGRFRAYIGYGDQKNYQGQPYSQKVEFKSAGQKSQTFEIPQTQIPGTPINGIDYYKALGVSDSGIGPFSFLFDFMNCSDAEKPGECKWGAGTIRGTTATDFTVSWTQESCGANRSVYQTRPICYPLKFCPLDSVNAESMTASGVPVVCAEKCPADREIAYLDSLFTSAIVNGETKQTAQRYEYRCMGNNDCSQPFKALRKNAMGVDECAFCTASQFYMRAAEKGKPGTCVDSCAYRNMTSPEKVMQSEDKYDGTHTYKEYYNDHSDMILPRGICERPDYANVHCPLTYNSSENATALDLEGKKAWDPEMVEKFKSEFGTFFMCYKRYSGTDDCKLAEQYLYPVTRNTDSDKSHFCIWCILPMVFNATIEACVNLCIPEKISYMGPDNAYHHFAHDYHMYLCDS